MLPILVQHLPRDRERLGVSEGHMAWLLGITRREYRELEAGRLHISNDLYLRNVDVCAGPVPVSSPEATRSRNIGGTDGHQRSRG